MAPSQDASDHQDYEPFLVGKSQPKPLFATGILGRGHTQGILAVRFRDGFYAVDETTSVPTHSSSEWFTPQVITVEISTRKNIAN